MFGADPFGSGPLGASGEEEPPATPGLIDTYPISVGVAYSVRKLRVDYAGAALRVRRSSDSTEQDISFSGVDLDTAALLAFAGAGSAFVTKWYDQSGNGVDCVQTTAGAQPRIVNAGVLDTENGKPAVVFDGTDDVLHSGYTSTVLSSTRRITCAVVQRSTRTSQTSEAFISFRRNNATRDYEGGYVMERRTTNISNALGNGGSANNIGRQAADSNTTALEQVHYFLTPQTTTESMWVNGGAKALSNTYVTGAGTVGGFQSTGTGNYKAMLGNGAGGNLDTTFDRPFAGKLSEVIVWPEDYATTRTGIAVDQATYFVTPQAVAQTLADFTQAATAKAVASAPGFGDPYFSSVKLLLDFDTVALTDLSPTPATVTAGNSAAVSTARAKFGATSLLLNGTNQYISSNRQIGIGALPFTVEAHIRPTLAQAGRILSSQDGASTNAVFFLRVNADGSLQLFLRDLNAVQTTSLTSPTALVAMNDAAWYHVAVTRDVANRVDIWLDGVSVANTTSTVNPVRTGNVWQVGAQYGAAEFFRGYIDNVRVTEGVARTIVAPTAPYPRLYDGTTMLLHMDGAAITDSSAAARAITVAGSLGLSSAQSKFGGSSASFNGTTQYLTTPNTIDFNFGAVDFTIEMWVYPTNVTGNKDLFAQYSASLPSGVALQQRAAKVHLLASFNGTSWGIDGPSAADVFTVNTWAHVALVRRAGTFTVYVNGVSAYTNASSTGTVSYLNSNLVRVGASPTPANFFAGYIDEVRVTNGTARYTAAFTPATVAFTTDVLHVGEQQLGDFTQAATAKSVASMPGRDDPYFPSVSLLLHMDGASGSTSITDSSSSALAFTTTSPASLTTSQSMFGGTSFFGAVTGYSRTTSAMTGLQFGSGDFTVEAFVYLTAVPGGDVAFVTNWKAGDLGWYFGVNNTRKLFFYWSLNGSTGSFPVSSGTISLNTWTHVAAVRSGSTLYLFINGGAPTTSALAGTMFSTTSAKLTIGADGVGSGGPQAYIDEVRITKGVARYTSAFTPTTVPFTDSSTPVNGQLVPPFTQAATATVAAAGGTASIVGAQVLAAFTQAASAAATASAVAAQTLGNFTQAAAAVVVATRAITGAQTLATFSQAATGEVIGARAITGAQTLAAFTQSATAVRVGIPSLTGAQTLAAFAQAAAAKAIAKAAGAQTFGSFDQIATVNHGGASAAAAQTLAAFTQNAAVAHAAAQAEAAQQLADFVAVSTAQALARASGTQVLPAFAQAAALVHDYGAVFEFNERTWVVAAANRTIAVAGADRSYGIAATLRSYPVVPQDRTFEVED